MDVYFEQSLVNSSIDRHVKRTKTFTVIRYVMVALAVIITFIGFMVIPLNLGLGTVIFIIMFLLLLSSPILVFIFLGRAINKMNMEFDYLINGSMFRIVKVINRKKRKKMLETSTANFESIGRLTSDTYDRYASDKEVKKIFALCEVEDEDDVIYIFYIADGVKYLLHIQPNDEMILALRQAINRITVLDKSIKTLNKKSGANEVQQQQ